MSGFWGGLIVEKNDDVFLSFISGPPIDGRSRKDGALVPFILPRRITAARFAVAADWYSEQRLS